MKISQHFGKVMDKSMVSGFLTNGVEPPVVFIACQRALACRARYCLPYLSVGLSSTLHITKPVLSLVDVVRLECLIWRDCCAYSEIFEHFSLMRYSPVNTLVELASI